MDRKSTPRLKGETRRKIRAYLAERDGRCCFYCRAPFGEDLAGATLDHWIPHCLWPTNRPRNLRLACDPCNQRKGDSLPWPVAAVLLLQRAAADPSNYLEAA